MISNKEIDVTLLNITQSQIKYLYADCHGYNRISPIKRTRKQQIVKAKHMMDWHNHTSYEWSQWWKESARKPKRWKNDERRKESIR